MQSANLLVVLRRRFSVHILIEHSFPVDYQSEKGFISLWRALSNFRVEFEIGGRATHNAAPALPTITSNKGQYIKVVLFKYRSWNEAI